MYELSRLDSINAPKAAERKVMLLSASPDLELTCATAAAVCYRKMSPERVMRERLMPADVQRLIRHCVGSGHLSTMEHGIIVVGFEGYSRSFLAQLSRHRHLGMDIQSQDYVDHSTARVCVPSKLQAIIDRPPATDPQLAEDVVTLSKMSQDVYRRLLAAGVEKDQAREKLLTEVEVRGVVSANPRAWLEFLSKRLCDLNGEQIWDFSMKVLCICKDVAPTIFEHAGPPCLDGRCPEGERCCGEPWNKRVWVNAFDAARSPNYLLAPEEIRRRRYEETVDEEWLIRRDLALHMGLVGQAPRDHA